MEEEEEGVEGLEEDTLDRDPGWEIFFRNPLLEALRERGRLFLHPGTAVERKKNFFVVVV